MSGFLVQREAEIIADHSRRIASSNFQPELTQIDLVARSNVDIQQRLVSKARARNSDCIFPRLDVICEELPACISGALVAWLCAGLRLNSESR
jgi:hypothetical protein